VVKRGASFWESRGSWAANQPARGKTLATQMIPIECLRKYSKTENQGLS